VPVDDYPPRTPDRKFAPDGTKNQQQGSIRWATKRHPNDNEALPPPELIDGAIEF
jgi:hypothetical protein